MHTLILMWAVAAAGNVFCDDGVDSTVLGVVSLCIPVTPEDSTSKPPHIDNPMSNSLS